MKAPLKAAVEKLQGKISSGHYATQSTERCLCGNDSFRILESKDRMDLHVASKLCQRCGLIHTDPKLDEESMAEFYDIDYYPVYFNAHSGPTGSAWLGDTNFSQYQGNIIYNYCQRYIKGPLLKVLELGCGNGRNLSQFKKQAEFNGIKVESVGIEYSSKHAKAASQVYEIDEVFDSIEALDGRKFNLIILSHVFEHFSDLERIVPRVANLLTDQGLLYVEVPGVLHLTKNMTHKLNFKQYSCLPHSYCYTLKTLEFVLSTYDFTLIRGSEFIHSVFRKETGREALPPPTDVVGAVNKMIELLKTPPYSMTSKALLAVVNQNYAQGIRWAERALDAQPDFPYAYASLAMLYAQSCQHQSAVQYALKTLESGIYDPIPIMLLLGRELEKLQRLDEAEKIYKNFKRLYPWDLRADTGLARIYNLRGDHAIALHGVRLMKDRWLYEPQAVLEEARALINLGHLGEAFSIIKILHKKYPHAPEPFFELGDIARIQNRVEEADSFYTKGLEIRPSYSWGWHCLAELKRTRGYLDEAIEAVNKCLRLRPQTKQARILHAGLLAQKGDYDKAQTLFEAIYNDHPDKNDLLLNIADVCRYRGDYEQALQVLDRFERRQGASTGLVDARTKVHEAMKTQE